MLTPKKRNRSNRRHRVVEKSSEDKSSSTEEEEEQNPTRKPKQTTKRTQRAKKEKAKMKKKASGAFDIDGPYNPGMEYDVNWSQGKKAAWNAARRRYHRTGTKEALADKVDGMKKMLKVFKARDVGENKITDLEAAIECWSKRRDETE